MIEPFSKEGCRLIWKGITHLQAPFTGESFDYNSTRDSNSDLFKITTSWASSAK